MFNANSQNRRNQQAALTTGLAIVLLLGSCGSLEGKNPFGTTASGDGFAGVRSMIPAGNDGTYLLTWSAVAGAEVSYKVFTRTMSSAYDFTKPQATTKETQYTTDDLRLRGSACYVVRFESAGMSSDHNTTELCVKPVVKTALFAGVSSITKNRNASQTVRWTKLSSSAISYNVFQRRLNESFDYSNPLATVNDDFYVSDVPPLGDIWCFTVRYGMCQET